MNAAANPTMIETRAPTSSCENTSEPTSVVPSQWSVLGLASTSVLDALGAYGGSTAPKIATELYTASTITDARPRLDRHSALKLTALADRGRSTGSRLSGSPRS